MPIKDRIEKIAKEIYGADGVDYSNDAENQLKKIQADPELSKLGLCMVKTHLSLSDNPNIKGVPKGWRLTIREVLTYGGAGVIVPVSGTITLMPGTSSNPAFKRMMLIQKKARCRAFSKTFQH
jgi:formate--tetrahydrofolate ligase